MAALSGFRREVRWSARQQALKMQGRTSGKEGQNEDRQSFRHVQLDPSQYNAQVGPGFGTLPGSRIANDALEDLALLPFVHR